MKPIDYIRPVIAAAMALLLICSCTHSAPTPPQQDNAGMQTSQETPVDTAGIKAIFIREFNLPDTADIRITKVVPGPESEKYMLLGRMKEIRKEIEGYNRKITALMFETSPDMFGVSQWNDDLCNFSDYAVEVNRLMLEYDKMVELLVEADFSAEETMYEANSSFRIFLTPSGHLRHKSEKEPD